MYIINSLIDTVKLIRSFADLSLPDAKIIAETWESAFHNNFKTNSLHEIRILGSMCRMITSRRWVIDKNNVIMVNKPILLDDIKNLST